MPINAAVAVRQPALQEWRIESPPICDATASPRPGVLRRGAQMALQAEGCLDDFNSLKICSLRTPVKTEIPPGHRAGAMPGRIVLDRIPGLSCYNRRMTKEQVKQILDRV